MEFPEDIFLVGPSYREGPPPSMLPKRLKCFYSYIRQKSHRGSQGQPWKMFINKATTSGLSCPSLPPGFTSPCQLSLVDCGESHHHHQLQRKLQTIKWTNLIPGRCAKAAQSLWETAICEQPKRRNSTMRKKVISKRGRPGTERALQKTAQPCVLNETFMLKLKHLC